MSAKPRLRCGYLSINPTSTPLRTHLPQSPNFFEIQENLYISDFNSACQPQLLKNFSIDVIINCSAQSCKHPPRCPDGPTLVEFSIQDSPDFEFIQFFEGILTEIESHLNKGRRILVHCNKGISRAPTLIIAYLMRTQGQRFEEVLHRLRKVYPRADPNLGFILQLQDFYVSPIQA